MSRILTNIFYLHICTTFAPTHLDVAVHGCGVQGGPAAAHRHVDLGAALDQPLHKVQLALARRLDQDSPTWNSITEPRNKACTTVMRKFPAWLLLSKTCKPFFSPL